jgi:hypothetical protein
MVNVSGTVSFHPHHYYLKFRANIPPRSASSTLLTTLASQPAFALPRTPERIRPTPESRDRFRARIPPRVLPTASNPNCESSATSRATASTDRISASPQFLQDRSDKADVPKRFELPSTLAGNEWPGSNRRSSRCWSDAAQTAKFCSCQCGFVQKSTEKTREHIERPGF